MNEEQQSLGDFVPDPARYRRCAQPFASQAEANEALEKFYDAVSEAREKFRIANVVVVVQDSVVTSDGDTEDPGNCLSTSTFGDSMKHETMLAFAFGQERFRARERMADLLAGKTPTRKL